jgi:hypothetical protein
VHPPAGIATIINLIAPKLCKQGWNIRNDFRIIAEADRAFAGIDSVQQGLGPGTQDHGAVALLNKKIEGIVQ